MIQCAGSKRQDAGYLKDDAGRRIVFVAHPELGSRRDSAQSFCRPDEARGTGPETWREYLDHYNQRGTSPEGLYRAGELYQPAVYHALVTEYGWNNVFILSAGWGLVRSDFLIPYYNITFSTQADAWAQRRRGDLFHDFNHLSTSGISPEESTYFFGGKSYLPLYYALTRAVPGHKVVFYAGMHPGAPLGYECIPYPPSNNWHYQCAKDFIEGQVPR